MQAVLWTLFFLVPGFIWSAVYAMLIPRKPGQDKTRFIEFFTLSSLNDAIWFIPVYLSYVKRFYVNHLTSETLLIFVAVFASPVIAAIITAKFKQHGWIARFMGWLGFETTFQVETAWEFKLSSTKPSWVVIHLKSGERILGFFGVNSFSGDPGRTGDLYLERTSPFTNDGQPPRETPNQGIWIAGSEIATIEFTEPSHGNSEERQTIPH